MLWSKHNLCRFAIRNSEKLHAITITRSNYEDCAKNETLLRLLWRVARSFNFLWVLSLSIVEYADLFVGTVSQVTFEQFDKVLRFIECLIELEILGCNR